MKLNWKQIALGVLTDWLIAILLFAACIVIFAIPLTPPSIEDIDNNTIKGINSYLAVFIGFISTMAGGYVAFGKNRDNQWKNIAVFITISLLLAVILRFNVKANMPSSLVIAGFILNIPAALLGGLWRWRNLQRTHRVLDSSQPPIPPIPSV